METKNQVPVTGIQRESCESSLLASCGYSEETQTLEVEFKNKKGNSVYQYGGVTKELYEMLINAESIGSTFLKMIKPFPAQHPFVKIETEEA